MEHLEDTLEFATRDGSRTLIFKAKLYAGEPPDDRCYHNEEVGQRIAFYHHEAITRRLGLNLFRHVELHISADRMISPSAYRARVGRYGRLLASLKRRPSLAAADHDTLIARLRHGVDAAQP